MKNAIITGGSRGIGAATAVALSKKGFNVIINYRADDAAAKAVVEKTGGYAFKCDVNDYTAFSREVEKACALFGDISVLVNNAGIAPQSKLISEVSDEEYERVFGVNVKGVFNATKVVLPQMIKNSYGRIVNLCSIWGEDGGSCEVLYSATKGAVAAYTKALSKEVGLSGITVNAVAPGFIDTEMNAEYSLAERGEFCKKLSLNRIGKSEEVASLIAFLCDEEASYITGQIIRVDGGM